MHLQIASRYMNFAEVLMHFYLPLLNAFLSLHSELTYLRLHYYTRFEINTMMLKGLPIKYEKE